MDPKPRLFLLDAYALIFRAYYAFINRPMINSKGINTSAIFGFVSTLVEVLKKENPDYLAVAFDPPAPTFRHQMFESYKANRLETPEEIKRSVPYIKQILDAFNIRILEAEGYEADDVIGTIAKMAEGKGWVTYMMTPDKDYAQLVSENIFMYKPGKSGNKHEVMGLAEIREMFQVEDPGQVVDILALWGDSTDNVPGVPGIGEKTSKALIAKYKSIEGLISSRDELKDKQRSAIDHNMDQLLLSRKLVTIDTDVPMNTQLEELKTGSVNQHKIREIFQELEFKTLLNRVLDISDGKNRQGTLFEDTSASFISENSINRRTAHNTEHNYRIISDDIQLDKLVDLMQKLDSFCFDTETTGLEARKAEIIGMAISFQNQEAYYIQFPENKEDKKMMLEKIKPVLENPSTRKIGQNLKYDIQVLKKYGITVAGEYFDTMVAHYLIQPELKHNMDYLAEVYLDYETIKIEELIGPRGKQQKGMNEVDAGIIKEYAGEDADITWQLSGIFQEKLKELNLEKLSGKIEMPLIRVLADMEETGFRINTEDLRRYAHTLRNEIGITEREIFKLAGQDFNISSPKQLGEILFERLKIAEGVKKTKSRQYSTSEEVLSKIAGKHPIVGLILDFRAQMKLLNTYVEALPALVDPETGRIHTSFDQAWVATGRLSSRNPNLQNIPVRDERGREIRKSFIPSKQHILLSADYSQIELRLMAHMSGDEHMIEAFLNDEDIHASTAAKIFKVPVDQVTREMRNKAKTANFGIIYGISAFGLSQRLNITRKEASGLIEDYFSNYIKVREYLDRSIEMARELGYVETIMGRRRYLKDIHSANAVVRGVAERNAINAPLQGSAADIIKYAMVKIYERISGKFRTKMILQVHDELIFDVFEPELDEIRHIVRHEMEHVVSLKVPLTVETGLGKNWLEAH